MSHDTCLLKVMVKEASQTTKQTDHLTKETYRTLKQHDTTIKEYRKKRVFVVELVYLESGGRDGHV